jgi:signal transduction histidine kinase
MKYKQLYLVNNLNPFKSSTDDNDGTSASVGVTAANADSEKPTVKDLMVRLREMEEINARLEKQVEVQSNKLAEVVATNAKFLSIIAHDLRSPFSSIIGVLELLKDSYDNYNIKEVEKYIRMATNSANGTLSLLDNLLSWTSAQNKAAYFTPVKINLHELITDELESISSSATHKLISLNHSIPPKLYLAADLQMVKTIFRNLISNAIKYSYIGGDITISASEGKHFVEITVEDNGIGITHKAQKELFKNNQIHSTRGTNNENGTGLGLILCKEFVEKHGGSIRIESEPGKGSKVKFTLPHYI